MRNLDNRERQNPEDPEDDDRFDQMQSPKRARTGLPNFRDPDDIEVNEKIVGKRIKADRAERKRNFFVCGNKKCKSEVVVEKPGIGTTHRNHCPCCLSSKHVDDKTPGDRKSTCGATMPPIAVAIKKGGEFCIIQKCNGCAKININRIAGDDMNSTILSVISKTSLVSFSLHGVNLPKDVRVLFQENVDAARKLLNGEPNVVF